MTETLKPEEGQTLREIDKQTLQDLSLIHIWFVRLDKQFSHSLRNKENRKRLSSAKDQFPVFLFIFRIDNVNGCAMILKTKKEFIFQGDCFMKALSSNERLLILINCFYNLANAMSAV